MICLAFTCIPITEKGLFSILLAAFQIKKRPKLNVTVVFVVNT